MEVFWNRLVQSTTLEPMIAMHYAARKMTEGIALEPEMMYMKVCHYEMGYNNTMCANIHEYEDINIQIQKRINNFTILRHSIVHFPPMIYGFIAGALTDIYGKKPAIIIPIAGQLFSCLISLTFYLFMEHLPLEFLILTGVRFFLGGLGPYFVAVYGYGATVTNSEERSTVLARYDAFESIGQIVGIFFSVIIFEQIGAVANFMIQFVLLLAALFYMIFFVKEATVHKSENADQSKLINRKGAFFSFINFIYKHIIKTVIDTFRTYFKKRHNHLRAMILLQIFIYSCYKWKSGGLTYLYMKRVFGVDVRLWALFGTIYKGLQAFALLVILPLLKKMGFHDTIIIGFSALTNAMAIMASAGAPTELSFLIIRGLTLMRMCQYGPGRALMSRTVDRDEIGKAMSGYNIVSTVQPFFSSLLMKFIYHLTLEDMPSAYMYIGAFFVLVGAFINFALYTKRDKFRDEDRLDLNHHQNEEEKSPESQELNPLGGQHNQENEGEKAEKDK